MRRATIATSIALVSTLLASACAPTLPHGKAPAPNTEVPGTFGGRVEQATSATIPWSEFFTDPDLAALIDAALLHNQELNIIALEVEVAQNEIMARRGDYLPKVDFVAGVGIEKVGTYTSQGKADDANRVAQNLPAFGFGFSASWEIDIWSKLRNATKAATLRYLASQEGRNFAVTLLVGEIANSYYELLALDAQLAVLTQNIEIQQNALGVVRLQKEAAKVTELAVKRFEAEVLKNQSRQFTLRQQIVEVENRINFLVGRFPQHVARSSAPFLDIVPPLVHTGFPSQLLENRPDVIQAQLGLIASDLDTRVAKASFYPTLGLHLSLGYQSFDFLQLVASPASLAYGIAADILAPLINRRALTAAYFTANAKQKQAVFNYERAILNAYIEVQKKISMIQNLENSFGLQSQQVDRLIQSIDISSRLFAAARADYMEVLLTRRDALEAQIELIENKKQQLMAAIALYQALGGWWR